MSELNNNGKTQDNSHMFVDEEFEDVRDAGGAEPKGENINEVVAGDLFQDAEETSTIDVRISEDNEDEIIEPKYYEKPVEAKTGKGFGIASLVCGILSITFFCSFINIFSSIVGFVLGIVHIKRGEGKAIAITGMVLSLASIVLLIVCMNLLMSNVAFTEMLTSTVLQGAFKM